MPWRKWVRGSPVTGTIRLPLDKILTVRSKAVKKWMVKSKYTGEPSSELFWNPSQWFKTFEGSGHQQPSRNTTFTNLLPMLSSEVQYGGNILPTFPSHSVLSIYLDKRIWRWRSNWRVFPELRVTHIMACRCLPNFPSLKSTVCNCTQRESVQYDRLSSIKLHTHRCERSPVSFCEFLQFVKLPQAHHCRA